jgi:prephenate dehydrogenase
VRHVDMVVLAVPVGCMAEIFTEIGPTLTDRAVVTDVAASKAA